MIAGHGSAVGVHLVDDPVLARVRILVVNSWVMRRG
jgi:hypothetical protein